MYRNVAPNTQEPTDSRFGKKKICHYVDYAGVWAWSEKRGVNEGNSLKDYFSKFSYIEFRLMILSTRFVKII